MSFSGVLGGGSLSVCRARLGIAGVRALRKGLPHASLIFRSALLA